MKSKKVWLFLVSMIILTTALFMAKVTGTEWIAGQVALFGLYIYGNKESHKWNSENGKKKK